MNYWIAVASREHVMKGVEGGFAQVCHGKPGPLRKMREGDGLVYYSSVLEFGKKDPCQKFTALGRVSGGEPYQFTMSDDFIPWRRNIEYVSCVEVPIALLLQQLSFIRDKKRWGYPFRFGCFSIPEADFELISLQMTQSKSLT